MGLRPTQTRWFEALTTREHLTRCMEALARTGAVELEVSEDAGISAGRDMLASTLASFERLSRRYTAHWPAPTETSIAGVPHRRLSLSLEELEAWAQAADPLIAEMEQLGLESENLQQVAQLIACGGDALPELSRLFATGDADAPRPDTATRHLAACACVVPPSSSLPRAENLAFLQRHHGKSKDFIVASGSPSAIETFEESLRGVQGQPLHVPTWLSGSNTDASDQLAARIRHVIDRQRELRAQLDDLHRTHNVAEALGLFQRLRWHIDNVPVIPFTRNFAVVTGWTADNTGEDMRRELRAVDAESLVEFPPSPAGIDPPLLLDNPTWVKPFEAFARLLGMPARHEADPSTVLTFLVPVMFGFMFGDVGQGAVLLLTGLILTRRFMWARLLIPCGASAVAFGFAFGSVFTREDLIPALWMHPINAPITLLVVAIAGGAVILVLGLVLDAVGAMWKRAARTWWLTDAAIVVVYAGLLGAVFDTRSLALSLFGVLWHVVGTAIDAESHRLRAGASAVGHLIERVLQLGVNTVSFARVGAFALAHAGLSVAVQGLASATESTAGMLAILVAGNIFAIALEGLVVGIQTTRLIMFEFFVRFLRVGGRVFRPLPPPPGARLAHASGEVPS